MSKIVTVQSQRQLATQKPWPKQEEVQDCARRLDRVVRFDERFDSITKENVRWKLTELQQLIAEFESSGLKGMIAKYAQDVTALDPEPDEWRDEDWNVQRSAVSQMLAFLVGSFPTSNLPDAAVFTIIMLDDVMALSPSFVELECACRKLRQSQKFMPSISEIVAAVKEESRAWSCRWSAMGFIEDSYNNAITLRDGELKRIEEEAARKADLALPFAVGHVVSHEKFGEGVVSAVDGNTISVVFGNCETKRVVASFLKRRLPPLV